MLSVDIGGGFSRNESRKEYSKGEQTLTVTFHANDSASEGPGYLLRSEKESLAIRRTLGSVAQEYVDKSRCDEVYSLTT